MNDNKSNQNIPKDKEHVEEAHNQAEKDMKRDPEVHSKKEPGDDLDEGELARLEGED